MKFGTVSGNTETSGAIGQQQQFSIQSSAIAFETLSSRLYSDPIQAVIRELSCNAYDAHVMTGKADEPFVVTLPTNFDASFKIRDFGPGMSNDEILSLYCTYFSSNKNSRNDAIGAFGLGSKSPFAYFLRNGKTGGFAVISYQSGVVRTYAAFIDNGLPKIELQSEAETTEPDGLEVIFPVEQRDVWEFTNKAKLVFEFFTPLPTCNVQLNCQKPEYSIEGEGWGLRKNSSTNQGNGVRAIMGMVPYSVGNIDISRLSENQKSIIAMPFDIFFAIGEVNPAVSRETLQLDTPTITAIQAKLDAIHTELLETVKKKVDKAANEWEAKMVIFNLLQHQAIGRIINAAAQKGAFAGTYTNFTLSAGKDMKVNQLDYSSIQVTHYDRSHSGRGRADRETLFTLTPEELDSTLLKTKGDAAKRSAYEVEIEANPNVVFILDDMKPTRANRYINYFIKNKAYDNPEKRDAYLISPRPEVAGSGKVASEVAALLAALGNPPMTLASSYETKYKDKMPKKNYVKRGKGLLVFVERSWYRGRHGSWRQAWATADETVPEMPGTKYYVVLAKGNSRAMTAVIPGVDSPTDLYNLINKMRAAKVFGFGDTEKIYGVRENSKLLKNSNWVPLRSVIDKTITKVMNPTKELAMSLRLRPFSNDWEFVMKQVAKTLPLSTTSAFQNFSVQLEAARTASKDRDENLVYVLNAVMYKVTNVTDFSEMWEKVEKQYPLLSLMRKDSYSGSKEEADALIVYLRMIDEMIEKANAPVAPPAPVVDKSEAYRLRKARNPKAYMERKRQQAATMTQVANEDDALVAGELTIVDGTLVPTDAACACAEFEKELSVAAAV
jgi:hypothetical protein